MEGYSNKCRRTELKTIEKSSPSSDMFLPEDVRQRICSCDECQKQFQEVGFGFLFDDTVAEDQFDTCSDHGAIESTSVSPEFDTSLLLNQALDHLPRPVAIEGFTKFNQFSSKIIEGLRLLTENDPTRVITRGDVEAIVDSVRTSTLGKRRERD